MGNFERENLNGQNTERTTPLEISSVRWCSQKFTLNARWQGAPIYIPNTGDSVTPERLEIRDSVTGTLIHERFDPLSARIGQLISYSCAHPERDRAWNCFNAVRLAIGCTTRMLREMPAPISGIQASPNTIVDLSKSGAVSPFIYEWIDSRRSFKTRGPVHTGIVLGYDEAQKDALVFEKNGDAPTAIRYWMEVVKEQSPITEQVNIVQFSEIFNDINLPPVGEEIGQDMWWL